MNRVLKELKPCQTLRRGAPVREISKWAHALGLTTGRNTSANREEWGAARSCGSDRP